MAVCQQYDIVYGQSIVSTMSSWSWKMNSYLRDLPIYTNQGQSQMLQHTSIFQFRLAGRTTYLVTGANVTTVFRSTQTIGTKTFLENVMERLWEVPKSELGLWQNDMSGRGRVPMPGTESPPDDQRHWAIDHHLYETYLTHKVHANRIALNYYDRFTSRLDKHPLDEWQTMHLMSYLKHEVTETAIESLFGTQILRVNPDFVKRYWAIDSHLVEVFSLKPRWLKRKALGMRDELVAMMCKYLDSAWENFDWNDSEAVEVS